MMDSFFYEVPKYEKLIPIRSKQNWIKNAMLVVKTLNNWPFQKKAQNNWNEYILINSIMNRVLIFRNEQIQSFGFPFTLKLHEYENMISACFKGKNINTVVSSAIFSIVTSDDFSWSNIAEFTSSYYSDNGMTSSEVDFTIDILDYLANQDACYFRHDYDVEHENGKKHPINHIDFYYSDHASIKYGTDCFLNINKISSMCRKDTDSFFLNEKA